MPWTASIQFQRLCKSKGALRQTAVKSDTVVTRFTFHSILTLLFCLLLYLHLLAQPHEYAGHTPCQFFELLPCIPWKMCWPELCTGHSLKQEILPSVFTSLMIHCAVWKIHLFFKPAKENKSRALVLMDCYINNTGRCSQKCLDTLIHY